MPSKTPRAPLTLTFPFMEAFVVYREQTKRLNAESNNAWAEDASGVYIFHAKTRSPQVQAAEAPNGRSGVAVEVIGM